MGQANEEAPIISHKRGEEGDKDELYTTTILNLMMQREIEISITGLHAASYHSKMLKPVQDHYTIQEKWVHG